MMRNVDPAAFINAAAEGNHYRINGLLSRMDHSSSELRPTADFRVKALHAAAERGHVDVVKILLQYYPHIFLHDKDELGRTILHVAAWSGQEELVRMLKRDHEQKVQVNAKAKGDVTPLHLASYAGHGAVVELLLSWWEANLDAHSTEKLTALHMAADGGHAEVVRMLLNGCRLRDAARVAAFINSRDCLWRTPLHYGCRNGHIAVVRQLLAEPEVNVNALDCVSELTPLHLAVWMADQVELVRLLLEHHAILPGARIGSSVNWMNGLLISNVLVAQVQNKGDRLGQLLPGPNLEDPFSSYDSVVWTEGRATVQIPREGGTALHIAAQENRVGCLRELLAHPKTDCNATDVYGMTALHHAAGKGHITLLRALISDDRVNINPAAASKGRHHHDTPLQVAIRTEQLHVVRELCAHPRLRANTRNGADQTALHMVWSRPGDVAEDMKVALLRREDVRTAIQEMQGERQMYQGASNALLVGGAIVAGCTFSSWLQPPLGLTPYFQFPRRADDPLAPTDAYESYAQVQHGAVRAFWILNSLSFYFAVFSFMAGIQIVLPKPRSSFVGDDVRHLRVWLTRASASLALAVLLVVGAFIAAGLGDLPPMLTYQKDMWMTTALGLAICIPFIVLPLSRRLWHAFRHNKPGQRTRTRNL